MGIFSRMRDIIHSNINGMLDKAEDPEKLITLMIQEMEDTLVEIKASCAQSMANCRKVERELSEVEAQASTWADKAKIALAHEREDLAKEALREKSRCLDKVDTLKRELASLQGIVDQYQQDLTQLEEKLASAREKHRVLAGRHKLAKESKKAQEQIRRATSSDAFAKFDSLENRIERMECSAELVNHGSKKNLEDEFAKLEEESRIARELDEIKRDMKS